MALLPIVDLGLKGFAAFWALITWITAAALQAKLNDYTGSARWVNSTNLTGGNVLIAAGIIADVYFAIAFFFIFTRPDHIVISMIADTVVLGVLFLLTLGGTAALSSEAELFQDCSLGWCALGSGVIGIGWIFTFLLLGILLLQVIYTLVHFGKSYATWRTPFLSLLQNGTRKPSAGISNVGVTTSNEISDNTRQTGAAVPTTYPPTAPVAAV